jgi:serine/threonine-protein kinase
MVQKLLHYEVIERLGEGARSTIYSVRDPRTGRRYALKHVVRKDDKDIRFIEQMEAEFEVSKQFNHPVLRKTYEIKFTKSIIPFTRPTEAFLLMELVEGKPLDEAMPRALLDMMDVFIQVAEGLKAMHHVGYVHCDLKPINLLRTAAGEIKIIDYGQTVRVGTVKERIQGTPDYIAPEQVARRAVTPQTDVFNLGATIYWALLGKTIPTLYTVNKGGEHSFLVDARIETPQQLNPKIPTALSKLVMECISTNPTKRPQSMEEVIQRLELVKHILHKEQGLITPGAPPPDLLADTGHGDHGAVSTE